MECMLLSCDVDQNQAGQPVGSSLTPTTVISKMVEMDIVK